MTYKQFNKNSILVEWPAVIDENVLNNVLKFKREIKNLYIKQLIEVINAYSSILIIYDNGIEDVNSEINQLKALYDTLNYEVPLEVSLWEVPVCYDDEFGIDLDHLSTKLKLSKSEIIKRHSQQMYTVYFLGFLPGFLYLGGLHNSLHCNRKSTPKLDVKKGAVGIGGNQTGIYPQNSPGGWHIIGNSPISFFDVSKDNPSFAKAGDKIKFIAVTKLDYYKIIEAVESNLYTIKNELLG